MQSDVSQMHNGSSVSWTELRSSRSAGSSTRSSSVDLGAVTGESGLVTSDELELGKRPCPRAENVGVTGEEASDSADESREWACEGNT